MSNIFEKIQIPSPPQNWFDLSHDHKTTFNMGQLIPFHCMEVLPNDVVKINSRNLFRFSPLASPAMARIKAITTYFFVPNRIIWEGWEQFFTGGQDPSDIPAMPTLYSPAAAFGAWEATKGSLADYFGIPKEITMREDMGLSVSALPFAAYQKIWYEYYRDQNLQEEDFPELTEGYTNDIAYWGVLRNRAWQHDYFTSALPFAQKGDAVSIPVDGSITGTGLVYLNNNSNNPMGFNNATTGAGIPAADVVSDGAGFLADATSAPNQQAVIRPNDRLSLDGDAFELSAISTTINDLRTANALQRWLEKNARGGSRFIETLKSHFGTSPLDARLQRPEMIGSNIQSVIISEVLQTSETATTPQGNLAGHGISASKDGWFSYHAQESGFIIGLVSVVPEAGYAQGLHRMFSRRDRLDYAWPDFANLGEQAIKKKELCAKETASGYNDAEFGYIPRYAEYKFSNNLTTGEFAPDQTLEYWTLTRKFDTNPATPLELNASFIVSDPSHRIFAVTDPDEHKILAHIFSDVKARRCLPKYGTPQL